MIIGRHSNSPSNIAICNRHAHFGMETLTYVFPKSSGFVDHADSQGGTGRYGEGDLQFLSTANGIAHSECHAVDKNDSRRTTYDPVGTSGDASLLQIWLNLPMARKETPPFAKMLWREEIPVAHPSDGVTIRVLAGKASGVNSLESPPASEASISGRHVIVLHAHLAPGSTWNLERGDPLKQNVVVYHLGGVEGENITFEGHDTPLPFGSAASVEFGGPSVLKLTNTGAHGAELMVLGGVPIGEPVHWHGPMVAGSPEQLQKAFQTSNHPWPHRSQGPLFSGKDRFCIQGGKTDIPPSGTAEEWPADASLRITKK